MTNKDLRAIKQELCLYRVKCDMAFSDKEDGVITQAEYEKAIEWQANYNAENIKSEVVKKIEERERALLEEIVNPDFVYEVMNAPTNGAGVEIARNLIKERLK